MLENKTLKIVSVFVVICLIVSLSVPALAAQQSDPWDVLWSYNRSNYTYDGLYSYASFEIDTPLVNSSASGSLYYGIYYFLNRLASDTSKISAMVNSLNSKISISNSNLSQISSKLSDLVAELTSPAREDIADAQEDNFEQLSSDFLSGTSSSSSIGVSDISDLQSFTSGAGVMLASPASADQFSSALSSGVSSSNGLKFFTQSVKDDLTVDSVRGSGEVYLDFLSPRLEEVEDFLGGVSR